MNVDIGDPTKTLESLVALANTTRKTIQNLTNQYSTMPLRVDLIGGGVRLVHLRNVSLKDPRKKSTLGAYASVTIDDFFADPKAAVAKAEQEIMEVFDRELAKAQPFIDAGIDPQFLNSNYTGDVEADLVKAKADPNWAVCL